MHDYTGRTYCRGKSISTLQVICWVRDGYNTKSLGMRDSPRSKVG